MIHGYAAHAAGAELHTFKYDPGELAETDVEVAVTHCGVSRSDVSLIDHEWGLSQYPFVPGHEIVGTVAALGARVRHLHVGQRVGIGWQASSCGACQWCLRGAQELCADAVFTCMGRHGGFADRVRVSATFALPLPEALENETTAPLLGAGNTVYTALRSAGIHAASRIGIMGIGGLGHLALQFARAFGAEVTALSTSMNKEEEARLLGASHFVNSRETKTWKALSGSFDLLLTTARGELDWNTYLQAVRPGGSLVVTGMGARTVPVAEMALVLGEKRVCGARGGGPAIVAEMLDVAARHHVQATVESFPLREVNRAVEKTRKGSVRYRAVLSIQ